MLDELVEHICRVNETVLAGEYASLAELTASARTLPLWMLPSWVGGPSNMMATPATVLDTRCSASKPKLSPPRPGVPDTDRALLPVTVEFSTVVTPSP